MLRYLFAILISTFMFAKDAKPDIAGSFVGIAGGTDQTMTIDIGLTMYTAGYTAWGFHVSSDSRQKHTENTYSNYTADKTQWGTSTPYETKSEGWSAGAYMNIGRVFIAGGMSWINQNGNTKQVLRDGTIQYPSNTTNTYTKPYVKVGYVIRHISIYVSHSPYYGTTAGIGFAF